jgi:dUTP pyrophosphatase
MSAVLRFVRLSKNAFAPTKGSPDAAGYDLYAAYDRCVPARGKAVIETDLQVEIPSNCYGRVAPRSGLATNRFIDVGAGVIDKDYRGNLYVILFNFGNADFEIKCGDSIAQLICEKIEYPELVECESLDTTTRGTRCFSSCSPMDE